MEGISKTKSSEQKIAFCFLTRGNLQKEDVWRNFLRSKKDQYNLYFHYRDGKSITQNIVLSNKTTKRVNTSIGTRHIVWATNILLADAYANESNKYFVLLSESCVPLYRFNHIYKKITSVSKSWIYYYKWDDEENIKRYNQLSAKSEIGYDAFYRQHPFMILTREHVKLILENGHMFEPFTRMNFPYEHYYITILKKLDPKFDDNNICYPATCVYKGSGKNDSGEIVPIKELNIPEARSIDSRENSLGLPQIEKSLFFRKVGSDTIIVDEKFNINKYFDKIYCINLDRRIDRWQKMTELFAKHGIEAERFSAIEGDKLDLEYKNLMEKNKECTIKSKYALGCLLSHLQIWKDAKEKGYSRILVFEDDVFISKYFLERIQDIQDIDWNICYLGASQYNWSDVEFGDGYYYAKQTLGTFCYAMNISAYDQAIDVVSEMSKPVDSILSEYQAINYGKCYTLYPNIVIADVSESNIRNGRETLSHGNRMRWVFSDFDIPSAVLKTSKEDVEPDIRYQMFP